MHPYSIYEAIRLNRIKAMRFGKCYAIDKEELSRFSLTRPVRKRRFDRIREASRLVTAH
jgi:hypothetical protein